VLDTAERAARRHFAQFLQGQGVAFEIAIAAIDPANDDDREEFRQLEGWRRAYDAARAQGIGDAGDAARHWAYDHLSDYLPSAQAPSRPGRSCRALAVTRDDPQANSRRPA
jgi:hypothetical protein